MDGIIVPILRLDPCPIKGFVREPVTVKTFQDERYKYCASLLAENWIEGRLRIIEVKLPDLDNEAWPFHAILPKGQGIAREFAETCAVITHNRVGRPNTDEIEWGYDIPPIGRTEAISYQSPTAAWLVLHPVGPTLLTRRDDDVEDQINKWLEHWARWAINEGVRDWPDIRGEGQELIVLKEMQRLTTLSRNRRIPIPKSVRRFICR